MASCENCHLPSETLGRSNRTPRRTAPQPTSASGVVNAGTKAGVSAFTTRVDMTREDVREEIFGEDYREDPAGPQDMRVA